MDILCCGIITKNIRQKLIFVFLFSAPFLISGILCNSELPVKTITVPENVEPHTTIGNLARNSNADFIQFLQSEPPSSDIFTVQTNGDVITKVKLDRETTPQYRFAVMDSDIYTVDIKVLDINDNSPTFNPSVRNITVPENTKVGSQVAILGSAVDPDLDINSTQRYELINDPSGIFRLNQTTIGNSDVSVVLILSGSLDYETQRSYRLTIRAFDGGGRSGDLTVNVIVSDVNDVVPVFLASSYNATVYENASFDQAVLTVRATDPEEGSFGVIIYELSAEDSSSRYDDFAVHRDTGVVSVLRALNYQQQSYYRLRVTARNPDSMQKASTIVYIQLVDINDHAPEIAIDFLFAGNLSEGAELGTNLIRLSVSDIDTTGKNFSVQLSDTGGVFTLTKSEADTFYVKLAKRLDRENTALYNISVTAWDTGTPPLYKTKYIIVAVGDMNDNAPVFESSEYTFQISELIPVGSTVGFVAARDSDNGENSTVSYRLAPIPGGYSDWFAVNNVTGLITTARDTIVCLTNTTPRFYIQARDGGTPSLSSQVLVKVLVADVNDNSPVFSSSFYNVTVSEERSVGDSILQVTATDSDCGFNAVVRYSLAAVGVTPPPQFIINSGTGVISLSQRLDFETKRIHEFPVFAFDNGNLSSTVNVKVLVSDVNDNNPVFYPVSYAANVRSSTDVQKALMNVQATDADSGVFGQVTYSISSGSGANYFDVVRATGAVVLKSRLPSSPPDFFQLFITATDGGGLASLTPANVTIVYIRDDTQIPLFNIALYQFSVSENSPSDLTVGVLSATVAGSPDGITYSIVSGDPSQYFRFDEDTIKTRSNPADREKHEYVLLNVQAEKAGFYGNVQVNISIIDENDNKPEFLSTVTVLQVMEDQAISRAFYTVAAVDVDSGPNGLVRYRLISNPDQVFSINASSGELSLIKKLDYETRTSHTVIVEAFDSGNPQLTNSLSIRIDVQDVNDNSPVFTLSTYEFSLRETANSMSDVGFVNASDRDSGLNGKIHYSIIVPQNNFGINPNTGRLYNIYSFGPQEIREPFVLRVMASDSGRIQKSTNCTVVVTILDENDNSPKFSQSLYEFSVSEDSPPGKELGSLSATDDDVGDNALLTFTLPTEIAAFSIDPSSGRLYLRSALDREAVRRFEFMASVTDKGSPSLMSQTLLRITVLDINDNSPAFTGLVDGVIPAYVYENKEAGTPIVQVTALDADEGENKAVSYSLSSAEQNFVIDSLTGWIRSKVKFEKAKRSAYDIVVTAKDNGMPVRSATVTVNVKVLEMSEAPKFIASYINFKTEENIRMGTTIGRINAYDLQASTSPLLNYTVLSANKHNPFDVNLTSGAVFAVLPVDYEAFTFHWMIVAVGDYSTKTPQFTNINVTITVIDRNDNVPNFTKDPMWMSVVENAAVGHVIGSVTARDADSGPNAEILYEIVSQYPAQPAAMFAINPLTGAIRTATTLDYERTAGVLLVIKATDQAAVANERLYSTMTVSISIEDVNDNFPVFQSRDFASVAEDEPIGFPILVIAAIDADRNNSVRYSIQSGDNDNKFFLNRDTGELKLNAELDREITSKYDLVIKATDTGIPQNSALQTLRITVVDVNDNPPRFLNRSYSGFIKEEQTDKLEVLKVEAVDRDEGRNGQIIYLIPPGIADDKFVVDVSGVIKATVKLDREQQNQYIFSAYVKDSAFPSLYDWCTITITVTDVNDHSPKFLYAEFYQSVSENLKDRTIPIFQAAAEDDDEGDNALITYSITNVYTQVKDSSPRLTAGPDASKFTIDAASGKIYAQSLDREQYEVWTLKIQARDNGIPQRQEVTTVTITVLDLNDNDPIFTNGDKKYEASFNETTEPGQYIMTISATDADKGNNSKLTYYISSNGTDGKFALDVETGVLRTSGTFDREKKSFYSFEVTAQDNALYDPRTKQTWVDIKILDVNDNAPVFVEFPFVRNVTAFTPIDQSILTVKAEDKDEGLNGQVEYSIESGGDFFKINPGTGDIKVKQSLLSATGPLMIKVKAVDKGTPPLSSFGFVEVYIGPSSSQQTFRFDNSTYTVHLDENAANGFLVLRLRASFMSGIGGEVTYSLSGDVTEASNPFTINQSTGEIRVTKAEKLDYEMTTRYRLVVVAISGGNTDYCTVWVNVRDINDNSPIFTQDRYYGMVSESANISTYITRILATDEDSGQNGEIEYRLQGDKASSFYIGSKSGILTLAQPVDREATEFIRVTLVAQDKGNPSKSGSSILRVTVLDENDNAPTFTNLPRLANNPVYIKEDMVVGQEIYVVSALDPDTFPSLTFAFSDGENPRDTFNLDNFSGRITLMKSLDYENVTSYVINVVVTDSLHPVLSSLYVSVRDVNDNPPIFENSSYEITIKEQVPPNTEILRVRALDKDSGPNGRVTYTLQGTGASDFYINGSTGWIYNKGIVNYSADKATINLAIKAADGGTPELSALVFVQIHVQDINNFAPVFSQTLGYTKAVSEREEPGVTIISISATDDDDSPENKRVFFSIIGGDDQGMFDMVNQESNIGNILLTKQLDRESKDMYYLLIQAADGGLPSKSSTTMVNITVSDFNDWQPVFSPINAIGLEGIPIINTSVYENLTAGSEILTVHASDRDLGDNAVVEYMIISGNDDGLFQMNQQTGKLSLAAEKTLDFEIKQRHRMQIRASDMGVPRLSTLATVDVEVLDVNDHKPVFNRLMYLETVKEKQTAGAYVFTAEAVDKDAGYWGNLNYALVGPDSTSFSIDSKSGDVKTAVEFRITGKTAYSFNVTADDPGGNRAVVQVQVQILKVDDYKPAFNQTTYNFIISDIKKAYVGMKVGQVQAVLPPDSGSQSRVSYDLIEESFYFNLSRDDGIIQVKNLLTEDPVTKRDVEEHSRHKRAIKGDHKLQIEACSGSQCSRVDVTLSFPELAPSTGGPVVSSQTLIIIIVVVVLVVVVSVVVIIVKTMKSRRNWKWGWGEQLVGGQQKQNKQMDTLGRGGLGGMAVAPPSHQYGAYPAYTASHDMTDRSQCASSGRGSAEFDDEMDEEITNINRVPLNISQRNKMMPDSGISGVQRDTDTISEHSARDHQEYLARLGIDPKKIGDNKKALTQSVESMHQFSDEGGGEADPLDISNLYNKLADEGTDDGAGENNINQMGFGEAPAQIGSLSSVTDANEEFTGSYNWDYLLNWGPQFQPLADVFTEIARLKDDSIQPKRKPVQTIPQISSLRGPVKPNLKIGGPPPIITATPPRVDHRSNLSSARTSQLTSMVSLPRSPISHESSFSNLAFSPNFTPALSPLATRSPSVSTLQSSGSRSHSAHGSRNNPSHSVLKQGSNNTGDMEFRI